MHVVAEITLTSVCRALFVHSVLTNKAVDDKLPQRDTPNTAMARSRHSLAPQATPAKATK